MSKNQYRGLSTPPRKKPRGSGRDDESLGGAGEKQILRCAQDDIQRSKGNGKRKSKGAETGRCDGFA